MCAVPTRCVCVGGGGWEGGTVSGGGGERGIIKGLKQGLPSLLSVCGELTVNSGWGGGGGVKQPSKREGGWARRKGLAGGGVKFNEGEGGGSERAGRARARNGTIQAMARHVEALQFVRLQQCVLCAPDG